MLNQRRSNDRRRRVVYSAQNAEIEKPTAASRRAKEKLREARQPTKAYGARVQRRLRGRWFSLVPIKRRSLLISASIIACLSLLLTYAHYATETWLSLAYAPEIARPLRLDRPDGFGRWVTTMLLVASSGVALLTYQLRRHRNDDYRGEYRLWRVVLIVMLFASVNSLVGLVPWAGSLLDIAFGKRIAFSGYDWLRIVLNLGGIVLALRLVVEVRRSRWALVSMLIACGFLALPEATKWKLFEVNSLLRSVLFHAAPLLGYTALFLGLVGYLRMLYREVRNIHDSETIGQRLQGFSSRVFARHDTEPDIESDNAAKPASRRLRREQKRAEQAEQKRAEQAERKQAERKRAARSKDPETQEHEVAEEQYQEIAETADDPTAAEDVAPRKKRRWFGLRSAKPDADEIEAEAAAETEAAAEEHEEPPQPRRKKKKRRFSLRLDPTEASEAAAEEAHSEAEEPEEEGPTRKKRRFGLSSWRKNHEDQAPAEEPDVEESAAEPLEESSPEPDQVDPDDIDWNSLSKAERRRLRKKLKRQGRAA